MHAIDTNVLVRLVARDDARQTATADSFVEGGVWVSLLVLMEATWVLTSVYEVDSARLGSAVEMLLDHDRLVLENPEVVRAALADFRARPSLGFSDCLICEVARKAGHVPIATFDRNVAKLEGTLKL